MANANIYFMFVLQIEQLFDTKNKTLVINNNEGRVYFHLCTKIKISLRNCTNENVTASNHQKHILN